MWSVEHIGSHTVSIRTHKWAFKRSCTYYSCNAPASFYLSYGFMQRSHLAEWQIKNNRGWLQATLTTQPHAKSSTEFQ